MIVDFTKQLKKYDLKIGEHYYRELIESITLEDRLDEVAQRTNIKLLAPGSTEESLKIKPIKPGQVATVLGVPFGEEVLKPLLNQAVVWEVRSENRGRKHILLTLYDRSIYLAKSDDEISFKEGTTATSRIQKLAQNWQIPIVSLPDTGQKLAKANHRSKNLWSIIQESLQETAEKSGRLWRVRMNSAGLELVELGKNKPVWVLDFESNIQETTQSQTLEGTVTKVKAYGNKPESSEKDVKAPLVATVTGELKQLGTIQKIYEAEKGQSVAEIRKAAEDMLTGIQETITIVALGINTIRAGDRVFLYAWNAELIVMSVTHNLGNPGSMNLELAAQEYVRRKYYGGRNRCKR